MDIETTSPAMLAQAAARAEGNPFFLASAFKAWRGSRLDLELEAFLFPAADRSSACVSCGRAIGPDEERWSPSGTTGAILPSRYRYEELAVVCDDCDNGDEWRERTVLLNVAEDAAGGRLAPLALCRRPNTLDEIAQVAERFGCDPTRLAEMLALAERKRSN